MTEQALTLKCEGSELLAIMHRPDSEKDIHMGVVIVVGGAQYRVGSHRMFVSLARALAAGGCTVLRFDRRGMGDSGGKDLGFDDCDEDIRSAVAALQAEVVGLEKVFLMGLCDGATAAVNCHFIDRSVSGYLLINPWIRSPQTEARVLVSHYYKNRFTDRAFWRDLFAGKVKFIHSIKDYFFHWRNRRSQRLVLPTLQTELFYRLQRADRPMLFALSEQDITGQEFLAVSRTEPWCSWLKSNQAELVQFTEADHTFSAGDSLKQLSDACYDWLVKQA